MTNRLIVFVFAGMFIFMSCKNRKQQEEISFTIVSADAETKPVSESSNEDAADDPAIWIHPKDPAKSTIIGTNKKSGLAVYNLKGEQLHFYNSGKPNNVDVRYGFPLNDNELIDLVATANRSNNRIEVYTVNNKTRGLILISDSLWISNLDEVYGFSLYASPVDDSFYAFVNSKDGNIEQWLLSSDSTGIISGKLVRNLSLDSQVEGMVADDELGYIFVGEETGGIWKFHAEPDSSKKAVKLNLSDTSNQLIEYDIEGLTLYYSDNHKGYLIASSQGNNSFAVFKRKAPHNYLGSFKINTNDIDGAEETDGIDVTHHSLGADYPGGLFVVQDGFNEDNGNKNAQNFKFIQWNKIAEQFEPNLSVNPTYDIK